MKAGRIEILNRGTKIRIRRMRRRIDMWLPMSAKFPRTPKVGGLRIYSLISLTKLKGQKKCEKS